MYIYKQGYDAYTSNKMTITLKYTLRTEDLLCDA